MNNITGYQFAFYVSNNNTVSINKYYLNERLIKWFLKLKNTSVMIIYAKIDNSTIPV